ncbi:unnamed protein product [Psylliodes chrysocephalus]|uniref:DUF7869 domain-containing protein n=1 Tax=Psylliodes chrysocephalus TaxID=3402493 RepID=A0A9P0CV66_9CUCU|nr:unnamed protein product [Psylliodes chrysocephala]
MFDTEEKWNEHKVKVSKATAKYKANSLVPENENLGIYSMDLQKVILLPIMPGVKDALFVSRLVAFNLTFCSLKQNPTTKNYCSMWHEGIAGRDGHNIVDAIFKVFQVERDVKDYIIWCDNCTGQNKNWILYTALVYLINQESCGINSVSLRYLTKGHTHMSADGIHGNIERIQKLGQIYDYEDLKEAVSSSRKKLLCT